MKELYSERLYLRPFRGSDQEDLFRLYGNAEVMAIRKIGTQSRTGSDRQLEIILDHWHRRGFGLWAVFDRKNGDFLGECGLREENMKGAEASREVELSYGLIPAGWGRGLATEAADLMICWGFEELGLPAIQAFARSDNAASLHILRKLGFIYESDFPEDGYRISRTCLKQVDWLKTAGKVPVR
ncbi:GNAT family N-acetyltransferase [Kiloniella laminariae]|uniref:GNAT family N-acetyltransferase n=1 Tax=Kiloniella laminariae TaxID=454162 RepID=A0ABT4LF44_9PROT|nr:GNAT family N-acetyltransferase [Kiloniella laminariae]MCZ4279712.1 GNAT family N-acetyltransferase [Kiloniella laminariae]